MIQTKNKYVFIVEKTATGFSMSAKGYPIFSTANHSPEVYAHILEALNLYLEEFGEFAT